MSTEKKWMTVMVEIETYDGEVQSVLPVDVETAEYFTQKELEEVHRFLREDDDASFDFMWDFRGLIRDAVDELNNDAIQG
jgi:hypothetical protein